MLAQSHPAAMHFCGFDTSCYISILYNWQTLIGGMIAIGAALYAGRYVRKQIAVSERIENDRLERRARAIRAILPLTLTKFIDFAEGCAETTRRVRGPAFGPANSGGPPVLIAPQIPQEAINDLERAIEATTNDLAVEIMTKLAGHSQVLHSIFTDIVTDVNAHGSGRHRADPNMPAFEMRIARVHAAASRLFTWARGEAACPEHLSWDHVESSLSILNIGDHATMGLINRSRERQAKPLGW